MEDKLEFILKKVSELYKRYGIKSVTMDDIARELGMSKKTLYQYVNDKTELVAKVIKNDYLSHHNRMTDIANSDLNAIEEVLEVYKFINSQLKDFNPSMEFDLKKYYPELYAEFKEKRRNKILNSIIHNIEKGKTEGYYREDTDPLLIAKLHIVRIEGLSENEIFNKENFTVEQFNQMFAYHIRGIVSSKGLDYFENKMNELNAQ